MKLLKKERQIKYCTKIVKMSQVYVFKNIRALHLCFFLTRTVLCNDPEMTLTPVNIPVDTFKLRIEKTAIRRVPGEAFHALHNLEYLWLPYNSLASLSGITFKGLRRLLELRLDGNDLISFPWETLSDMPQLRLLDLHNNELTSIPPDAARYIKNITYLDLSSNKLMTLPQALISTWANLQAVPYFPNDNSKIILGKSDCDFAVDKMTRDPGLIVAFSLAVVTLTCTVLISCPVWSVHISLHLNQLAFPHSAYYTLTIIRFESFLQKTVTPLQELFIYEHCHFCWTYKRV